MFTRAGHRRLAQFPSWSARRGRAAFTLLELLVVIGIISLLAAILTPAVKRARVVSRRAKCLANLRSIGQGMQSYMNQNEDRYPYAAEMPSVEPIVAEIEDREPYPPLSEVLLRHCGGVKEVFACPADKRWLDRNNPHEAPLLGVHPPETTYYATEGLSYQWISRYNGKQPGRDIFTDRQGMQLGSASAPLLYGFDSFHGRRRDRGSMCMLFADLHAAPDDYWDGSSG